MTELIVLTQSEYTKIIAKNKSKTMLIILSLFTVGCSILYYLLQNQFDINVISGDLFSIWILNLLMRFLLPLFIMLLMSDSISGEFQDGTMKNMFSFPVSRMKTYISKLLAAILYTATLLATIAIISLIASFIANGASALNGVIDILFANLGALMVLGLIIVLSGLISLFVNSSSMSLVINLLVWLGMGTLGLFFSNISVYLPTSFVHWYEPLIYDGNVRLVIPVLLYMISYYIILTILGMLKFQTKEV